MSIEEFMITERNNRMTYSEEYVDRIVHSERVVAPAELMSILKILHKLR
jgi:hypothetical protein